MGAGLSSNLKGNCRIQSKPQQLQRHIAYHQSLMQQIMNAWVQGTQNRQPWLLRTLSILYSLLCTAVRSSCRNALHAQSPHIYLHSSQHSNTVRKRSERNLTLPANHSTEASTKVECRRKQAAAWTRPSALSSMEAMSTAQGETHHKH